MFLFTQSVTSREYAHHAGLSYSRHGVLMILEHHFCLPRLDTCTAGMCSWKICIRILFDSRNGSPCHCNIYCNSIFPLFIPIRGFFPDYAPGIFRHKKRRSKRVIIGYSGKIFHERPGKTWKKASLWRSDVFIFEGKTAFSPEITIRAQNALHWLTG